MIQCDSLIVEMLFLAAIIFFSVYLEHRSYKRLEQQKDYKGRKQSLVFIKNDLEQRQPFIEESLQFRDYKPFFTDMWDAIVIAEGHSCYHLICSDHCNVLMLG